MNQSEPMKSSIPPPGEEATFPLNNEGLTVRHGSSLSLMSNVCEFLANPIQDDSFNYVDPTAVSIVFLCMFLVHLDVRKFVFLCIVSCSS